MKKSFIHICYNTNHLNELKEFENPKKANALENDHSVERRMVYIE